MLQLACLQYVIHQHFLFSTKLYECCMIMQLREVYIAVKLSFHFFFVSFIFPSCLLSFRVSPQQVFSIST